ncbi:MAG: ShlB/FhaC/HecB family hemolysin secretion/activation protein [Gammaproteobacteria bacterium]|nr:ShlB/FhaC/HecB family hemolysin secretion/activation protein [Gammaproteobacteria bacterium]
MQLPPLPPQQSNPGSVLPRLDYDTDDSDTIALARPGRSVQFRAFRIVGNTVLSETVLTNRLQPYVGRRMSFEDMQHLRDDLTRAYIEHGYLNSGALIPDQTIEDGVLTIVVREGVLTDVRINNTGRLRRAYISERLRFDGAANVFEIEQRLREVQQNERIARIDARLQPGPERGSAVLVVDIEEAPAFRLDFSLDNYTPPSIGAETARVGLAHTNVSGIGDSIAVDYNYSEGLEQAGASYRVPFGPRETSLELRWRNSRSENVEAPVSDLGIDGRAESYGLSVSVPLRFEHDRQHELFFTGEVRRSKSFLFGSPFSFSRGVEDGVSKVGVLRIGQDWTRRSRDAALAARSTFSFGLDVLDATRHSGDTPDGRFVAWLGQLQWARRLSPQLGQLLLRADLQLSNDPLLGLEQFAIGGHSSVRGYRENVYIRDQGVAASVEWRVPLMTHPSHRTQLELASFADAGYVRDRANGGSNEALTSVGLGLRWTIAPRSSLEVYWAEALRDAPAGGEHDLQDDGLHMRLDLSY